MLVPQNICAVAERGNLHTAGALLESFDTKGDSTKCGECDWPAPKNWVFRFIGGTGRSHEGVDSSFDLLAKVVTEAEAAFLAFCLCLSSPSES